MKKCKNCNADLDDNAEFCDKCGLEVKEENNEINNDEDYDFDNDNCKFENTEGKKAKRIAGIILGILFVLAIIGMIINPLFF